MTDFVQTLVTSLAVGSLYSLIALGYTMVYGILKFINFAHSDIVVLGAWLSYAIAKFTAPRIGIELAVAGGAPPLWFGGVILLVTMLICAAIGFLIERLAYRPLRRSPRLNVLITAIGVSLLLQNAGQLPYVFGASPERMPNLLPNYELLKLQLDAAPKPAVIIGLVDVTIFVTAAVLMLALEFVVHRTKFGIAMRAVSFNTETATLMGVNANRVISVTFMVGAALAAAAGFLHAMKYPSLQQPAAAAWVLLGLKAFVAAVVGGIGNLRGAVLGGFVIAAVEQFGGFYLSSSYRDVYVFALLIAILLVRPSGILGSTIREKV